MRVEVDVFIINNITYDIVVYLRTAGVDGRVVDVQRTGIRRIVAEVLKDVVGYLDICSDVGHTEVRSIVYLVVQCARAEPLKRQTGVIDAVELLEGMYLAVGYLAVCEYISASYFLVDSYADAVASDVVYLTAVDKNSVARGINGVSADAEYAAAGYGNIVAGQLHCVEHRSAESKTGECDIRCSRFEHSRAERLTDGHTALLPAVRQIDIEHSGIAVNVVFHRRIKLLGNIVERIAGVLYDLSVVAVRGRIDDIAGLLVYADYIGARLYPVDREEAVHVSILSRLFGPRCGSARLVVKAVITLALIIACLCRVDVVADAVGTVEIRVTCLSAANIADIYAVVGKYGIVDTGAVVTGIIESVCGEIVGKYLILRLLRQQRTECLVRLCKFLGVECRRSGKYGSFVLVCNIADRKSVAAAILSRQLEGGVAPILAAAYNDLRAGVLLAREDAYGISCRLEGRERRRLRSGGAVVSLGRDIYL